MTTATMRKTAMNKPLSEKLFNHEAQEMVPTRFGEVHINREHALNFPKGLLGLPDDLSFCLGDLPGNPNAAFKVLQCLNDTEFSMLVLPIALDNTYIERSDMIAAANLLNIPEHELAVMLITTVTHTPSGIEASVNTRAPIFLSTEERIGGQFVFPHSKYVVRQPLEG